MIGSFYFVEIYSDKDELNSNHNNALNNINHYNIPCIRLTLWSMTCMALTTHGHFLQPYMLVTSQILLSSYILKFLDIHRKLRNHGS